MKKLSAAAAAMLFLTAAGAAAAPGEAPAAVEEIGAGPHAAGGIIKFGEDILVAEGEQVNGPVMAIGGSLQIDGKVNGPVVSFGGSTTLGPKSSVNGPAVSVGGKTGRAAGSRIDGPIVDTPGARLFGNIAAAAVYIAAASASIYIFVKASTSLGWIVLALVLIALFPKPLRHTKDCLERKFFECGMAGLIAWPCLCVISMTLLMSIIGIPLLPLLTAVAAAAYVWGFSALAYLIGERLAMGRWKNQLVSMLVGMLILKLMQWIPVVQWLVCVAVALVGVGASILSGFGVKHI